MAEKPRDKSITVMFWLAFVGVILFLLNQILDIIKRITDYAGI